MGLFEDFKHLGDMARRRNRRVRYGLGPTELDQPDQDDTITLPGRTIEALEASGWIVCSAGNVEKIGVLYDWSKDYTLRQILKKDWILKIDGFIATRQDSAGHDIECGKQIQKAKRQGLWEDKLIRCVTIVIEEETDPPSLSNVIKRVET